MHDPTVRPPVPPPPPAAEPVPSMDRGAGAAIAVAVLAVVVIAVGLIALVAASGGRDTPPATAAPAATTTTTAAPATTTTTTTRLELPASVTEQMYLSVVRDRHGDVWAGTSDADLIAYPTAACDALDSGIPPAAVLEVAESSFYDEESAAAGGFALGAGIEAFCPEYTEVVTAVTP